MRCTEWASARPLIFHPQQHLALCRTTVLLSQSCCYWEFGEDNIFWQILTLSEIHNYFLLKTTVEQGKPGILPGIRNDIDTAVANAERFLSVTCSVFNGLTLRIGQHVDTSSHRRQRARSHCRTACSRFVQLRFVDLLHAAVISNQIKCSFINRHDITQPNNCGRTLHCLLCA